MNCTDSIKLSVRTSPRVNVLAMGLMLLLVGSLMQGCGDDQDEENETFDLAAKTSSTGDCEATVTYEVDEC